MKKYFHIVMLLAAGLLPFQYGFAQTALSGHESSGEAMPEYRAGELLVKLEGVEDIIKLRLDPAVSVEEAAGVAAEQSGIAYAEPNGVVGISVFPNDTEVPRQKYLVPINAQIAWEQASLVREIERLDARPIIAILDTGVDATHPDLASVMWANGRELAGDKEDNDGNGFIDDVVGWDFVQEDADPSPDFSGEYEPAAINHGTIVAGIAAAAANNAQGTAGIGWHSQVMPIRVVDSTGYGEIYNVIKGIQYAVNQGAKVINMSFVGPRYSQSLEETITWAYDRGVVVVAAAGNTDAITLGDNLDATPRYPVCFTGGAGKDTVIGVGSVDGQLRKSAFSNYGGCVDLVAPGEEIYAPTVRRAGEVGFEQFYADGLSGTSLAAPQVSGVAALLLGLRPGLTPAQVARFIRASARSVEISNPTHPGQLGAGLLNIAKAVDDLLRSGLGEVRPGQKTYVATGLGFGTTPQVNIATLAGGTAGRLDSYARGFRSGINIATGDLDRNGVEEIVTAPVSGGAHIKVFLANGLRVGDFFAFDQKQQGGASIAIGDVVENGFHREIIVGAGKGARPLVRIFDLGGHLLGEFAAFDSPFTGGVRVAVADVNNDGYKEIIAGAGAGGATKIRIFTPVGTLLSEFSYDPKRSEAVSLAADDINGDGEAEIIAGLEGARAPEVKVFTAKGAVVSSFLAFEKTFVRGVFVAAGDTDSDGKAEILVGRGVGGTGEVRIFDGQGKQKQKLQSGSSSYRGGARPAALRY